MKEENNIEKLFQDAFENFEVTPPVSVKMEIDKALGSEKNRLRWIFWWSVIIVLLLTGVVFAVINSESYHSAAVPESTASEQHSRTNNDPVNTAENTEKIQPASEHSEGSALESEMESTEVKKDELSENSPLSPTNTLKNNPKKKMSFSSGKGAAAGSKNKNGQIKGSAAKNENSAKTNQKAPQVKKNVSTQTVTAKKNSLKTSPKKKSTFSAKKNSSVAGKENRTGSEESNIGKPAADQGQLPETTEKQPEKSDETKTDKKFTAADTEKKTEPADSIANVAVSVDSTAQPETVKPLAKQPEDNSKARNWMVEIYGGPRFGVKTSKTDFVLKSANSYQIGLGFSRSVNLGPLKYVTLDGEYGGGKESYRQETITSSVYLAGIDSVPVLDSTMTDTLYYDYVDNYDTLNQTTEVTNNAQITRFAFGLRAQFNFDLGSGFGLAVSPGYYYSRSKFKFSDSSGTGSSSSSQILLGLSVYYDWNRFRFRVGLDSRYELMGKNQLTYIDRRKSVLFSTQFGVAFKF